MSDSPKHPPLYKIMSSNTGKIVLRNQTLRWTTPPTLNDPFDVQSDIRLSAPETDGVKQAALDMLWESIYEDGPLDPENVLGRLMLAVRHRLPKMDRRTFDDTYGPGFDEILARPFAGASAGELRAFMSRVKILCLTDRYDCVPMWSHYGQQHQGVALRFCTPPGFDSPWKEARPIKYSDSPPTFVDRRRLPEFLAGRYSPNKRELFEALTYTKGSEWKYESEWRINSGDGRSPEAPFEDLPFHPLEVDAIILGCRMHDQDRAEFVALREAHFPHAELLTALPRSDAYLMGLRETHAVDQD